MVVMRFAVLGTVALLTGCADFTTRPEPPLLTGAAPETAEETDPAPRAPLAVPKIHEAPPPDPDSMATDTDQVVEAHNRARADAGLPPLEADSRLTAAARDHARAMARDGRMRHRGSDGSSPFERIEAAGYSFRAAGENIAAGEFTTESLMRAWMRSPGHRRNVLGTFSQIGVGAATATDGTSYWCVTFGTPR